ncbi:MAG: Spy/CpxP family protein refolding chaperone [Acidobacteriota bacterium]
MYKWRTLVWSVVLTLALPALADAQGFMWWRQNEFKTDLSLTADQCGKLEAVYQGLLPRMTTAKQSLDTLEKQLSAVIAEGTASEHDVMKLVDLVEGARAELGKTRTLMIYRLHQILTPEQRVKMKALHDRWEQERRKRDRR